MTQEEARQYKRQYRREGYGRNADARYRKRHLEEIRAKDRERKRKRREADSP